jgi:hypothetical protein
MRTAAIMFILLMLDGCAAPSGMRIRPRTIPGIGIAEQNELASLRMSVGPGSRRSAQWIISAVSEEIERGSPYRVAVLVDEVAGWANLHDRQCDITTLVDRCCDSEDSLVRWAGIRLAYHTDQQGLAEELLRRDYATMLIRPDPPPWWAVAWWDPLFRGLPIAFVTKTPAWYIAGVREDAICWIGEFGIVEAIPILRCVEADHHEWYTGTKEAARASLSSLGVEECQNAQSAAESR